MIIKTMNTSFLTLSLLKNNRSYLPKSTLRKTIKVQHFDSTAHP